MKVKLYLKKSIIQTNVYNKLHLNKFKFMTVKKIQDIIENISINIKNKNVEVLNELIIDENLESNKHAKLLQNDIKDFYKKNDLQEKKDKIPVDNKSSNNIKTKHKIGKYLYRELLKKGMLGNLSSFIIRTSNSSDINAIKSNSESYNNNSSYTNLNLLSTVYDRIEPMKIVTLMNNIHPDITFIHFRPDLLLSNISKKCDKVVSGEISSDSFLKDLIRDPLELHPCSKTLEKLMNDDCFKIQSSLKIDKYKKLIELLKKMKIPNFREKINFELISTVCLFNDLIQNKDLIKENKLNKIMIGDIPINCQIKKLVNSNSLLQLKKMFETICVEFPNNPDFEPQTLLTIAQYFYPNEFLRDSDLFISSCLEYLVKHINNNNSNYEFIEKDVEFQKIILAFTGYGQSMTIPYYMENVKSDLKTILNYGKRYSSLITGNDTLEIICDKLSILYLIFFGVTKVIPKDFYLEVIEYYIDEDIKLTGYINKEDLMNKSVYLFNCLVDENRKRALEFIKIGLDKKKSEFINRIK